MRPQNLSSVQSARLASELESVLKMEELVSDLELDEIKEEFKDTDDIVYSFALIREAAFRVLGMKAYPVQILGGLTVASGMIAEMKTGEGKTLTVAFPAAYLAKQNRGVHVATANDYLAARDGELMRPLYEALGLTVGTSLSHELTQQKQAGYACSITYSTAQQLGFDYLNDNLTPVSQQRMQREHAFAIVDEADSLLIDEAKTPLIISGPSGDSDEDLSVYAAFAASAVEGAEEDVEVDRGEERLALTPKGIQKAEDFLGVSNLYDHPLMSHRATAALQAQFLFTRNKDYLIQDGAAQIIDTFTGRVLEGRRYQNGLHEAIEAKEGIPIAPPSLTLASVALQSYFGLYEHLSGMTGTAATDAAELFRVYKTPVAVIPTNRPSIRLDLPDKLFQTREAKLNALAARVEEAYKAHRPVLIGTSSVQDSEEVAARLNSMHIPHNVLSAKNAEAESHIIAQAGRPGSITVATNMAGRGVDIRLGGDAKELASAAYEETAENYPTLLNSLQEECLRDGELVKERGGLLVLSSARNTSRRVDNQLRGRSGRQGEPGETQFFLSLEDDLLSYFAADRVSSLVPTLKSDASVPLPARFVASLVERSQKMVEQRDADSRQELVKFDRVYSEQQRAYYTWRSELMGLTSIEDFLRPILSLVYQNNAPHATHAPFPHNHPIENVDLVELAITAAKERYQHIEDSALLLDSLRGAMVQFFDLSFAHHLTHLDALRDAASLQRYAQVSPHQAFALDATEPFVEAIATGAFRAVNALWLFEITLERASATPTEVFADDAFPSADILAALSNTPDVDEEELNTFAPEESAAANDTGVSDTAVSDTAVSDTEGSNTVVSAATGTDTTDSTALNKE